MARLTASAPPRTMALLALLNLALLLHGCGFQLRGQAVLPPALTHTWIEGGRGDLLAELRQALRDAGAELVDDRGQASAVLRLLEQRNGRRVLSVRPDGKVLEYELTLQLRYTVEDPEGHSLLGPQRLEVRRDYLFDRTDVLGKSVEEEALRRDMTRDLVRLLMLRLSRLQP